jgi:hypothetical protein
MAANTRAVMNQKRIVNEWAVPRLTSVAAHTATLRICMYIDELAPSAGGVFCRCAFAITKMSYAADRRALGLRESRMRIDKDRAQIRFHSVGFGCIYSSPGACQLYILVFIPRSSLSQLEDTRRDEFIDKYLQAHWETKFFLNGGIVRETREVRNQDASYK